MPEHLKNCWEIKQCGREPDGANASELGTCVAASEGLGHSCWAIAGTLCGGVIQGSVARKERNCVVCEVYKLYHRMLGTEGEEVAVQFPDEERRYSEMLLTRLKKST